LNLTSASLTNIVSATGINIGSSSHTGDIIVSSNMSTAFGVNRNVTVTNNGLIDLGSSSSGAAIGSEALAAQGTGNLTIDASTSNGRIVDGASGVISVGTGKISLKSYNGIGDLAAPAPTPLRAVTIGTVGGGFSAVNSTNNDIYVSVLNGASPLTLGGAAGNLVSGANNQVMRVESTGNIVINANIAAQSGQASLIDLRATGSITKNTGTLISTNAYL